MFLYILISSTAGAIINSANAKRDESKIPFILEGAIKGPLLLPYLSWEMLVWMRKRK